jgi:nucleotide-binding universal stress UspA family protein
MNLLERILFPVDFSARSDGASVYVEALAGRFLARLTLLHVVEIPIALTGTVEFGAMPMQEFKKEHVRYAQERLETYLAEELKHLDVDRVVMEGDAGREIVEHAHANHSSLIMMPTHGMGPFRRYILGSVTAKVLHDAHCPVWTGVHLEDAPPLEQVTLRRIVCAVDLGPESERALRWAAAMAGEYQASLLLAHAEPMVESRPGKYFDQELFVTLYNQAREAIAELQKKAGTSAEVRVEAGEPARVIRALAQREAADLVVIARGSAGEGHGRLRTHAYGIIRNSPCPVVSV